jgi:catalase
VATQAEEAVAAIHASFGRHPGHRAVHAKGTLCKGSFRATPEAARLTTAAHMQGEAVPVTVRFSNAGGNPGVPDYAQDARGMATKFYLPDGGKTDIVAITLPSFFVRTPEDFIALTRGSKPVPLLGIPGPRATLFLATHRESWRAARAALSQKPPESFATCRFNALHAFRWIDPEGHARFVRYSWLPEAGEATISGGDAKRRGADYLGEEIYERLGREPVRFTLELQLADDTDASDDPTTPWPDERQRVRVGTLELTEPETGREQGDDILVFDPTRVTAGIELSDDQILRFRSHAYSVSIEQRSGATRPANLP